MWIRVHQSVFVPLSVFTLIGPIGQNVLFSNTRAFIHGIKVRITDFSLKISYSSYVPDYLMDFAYN